MTCACRLLFSTCTMFLLLATAACGPTTVSRALATSAATATQPTTVTTPTSIVTSVPDPNCPPDEYGIYAEQTGYITRIDVAGLPAPPQTKHGIGSTGVSNGVARGGFTGMCSLGTADSINAFYMDQLPTLGWMYGLPPSTLTAACTAGGLALWSGQHWWKGPTLFTWDIEGPGAAGSTFWGYSFCALVS